MAVQYYNDDTIAIPAPINCKVVVNPPVTADLFSTAPETIRETTTPKTVVVQPKKPANATLTLFDL